MKGKEIYKVYPGSEAIVIFIHGILEGPKQFRRLAQIAYEEGYTVYILLLPGHGGSGEYFGITDYKAWVTYVSRQIVRMKKHYKHLILVGHSMGALLTICEGACFPNQVKALVLIDTPIVIRLWPRVVKGAIKIAEGKGELKDHYTRAEYRAISVRKPEKACYLEWVIRYLDLLSLILYSKKQIQKISQPMLLIFAKKDEFVSLKSIKYFKTKRHTLSAERKLTQIVLKDSGHFCYHHEDLLQLEAEFRIFVKNQNKTEEVLS